MNYQDKKYINKKLKKGLILIGITGSILGVVAGSIALWLQLQNEN